MENIKEMFPENVNSSMSEFLWAHTTPPDVLSLVKTN